MDYGLLGGIGKGLQAGLEGYLTMKKMKRDEQVQNLTHGLIEGPEGQLQLNPEKKKEQEQAGLLRQVQVDEHKPGSGYQLAKSLGFNVDPNISAHEFAKIKDVLVAKYKADKMKELFQQKMGAKPPVLSKGEEALDKDFAKEYSDYIGAGGYKKTENSLQNLSNIVSEIEEDPSVLGGISRHFGDKATMYGNPKLADIKERVQKIIQSDLKPTLGGQFTEKEAMALMERAFNPRLSAEQNLARLKQEIADINKVASAKMDSMKYFESGGTLKGFKGTDGASGLIGKDPIGPTGNKAGADSKRARYEELKRKQNGAK